MAAYNTNTDLVLGDDLFLYITDSTDKVLAFATSVNVEISADEIDTSNKMSGAWRSNLAGKSGYNISSDALFTQTSGHFSYDALMALMVKREKVDWKVGRAKNDTDFGLDESKPYYSGSAFITSLSLSAGNNEVATCSVSLSGSGAIALTGAAAASVETHSAPIKK